MSIPAISKTWQYDVNVGLPEPPISAASRGIWLRRIKTAFLGFAVQPWTTGYSCDSVTAGSANDGTDRWTTDAKVVWSSNTGTGVRSWYVFKQSGLVSGFQLCIHCKTTGGGSTGGGLELVFSVNAGFTGGTTTARPTATDEVIFLAGAWANGNEVYVQAWTMFLHVMQSTDGQATRVFITPGTSGTTGGTMTFWLFDKISSPVSGWTYPVLCTGAASSGTTPTSCATYAFFMTFSTVWAQNSYGYSNLTSGAFSCAFTCEGAVASTTALWSVASRHFFANDFDGSFPLFSIGVYSEQTGNRGKHGTVPDLFWGRFRGSTSGPYGYNGDCYPNSTARTLVSFGVVVHPWNGSQPLYS